MSVISPVWQVSNVRQIQYHNTEANAQRSHWSAITGEILIDINVNSFSLNKNTYKIIILGIYIFG